MIKKFWSSRNKGLLLLRLCHHMSPLIIYPSKGTSFFILFSPQVWRPKLNFPHLHKDQSPVSSSSTQKREKKSYTWLLRSSEVDTCTTFTLTITPKMWVQSLTFRCCDDINHSRREACLQEVCLLPLHFSSQLNLRQHAVPAQARLKFGMITTNTCKFIEINSTLSANVHNITLQVSLKYNCRAWHYYA